MSEQERIRLHAEIMNIPCCPYRSDDPAFVLGYKFGHRDARHAAAELALATLPDSAGEAGPVMRAALERIAAGDVMRGQLASTGCYSHADTVLAYQTVARAALAAAPAPAFERALELRIQQGWQLGGNACPILYTDEINGQQVCRDDLWIATTAGLKGAPAPAVKGYHPGVSGEATSGERDL